METTMYDTLLQLPLFQGLCKEDFTSIIEKVKFHFHNINAGQIILRQGELCNQLTFLLDGELSSHIINAELNYHLTEIHKGPFIVEPYSLFGMTPTYTSTYRAYTDVKMLTIDKSFILSDLFNYEIFRINYMNILSNRCQYLANKLSNSQTISIQDKFVDFFRTRCLKPEGEKTLHITMEDLATLIGETRINVSKLLNDWQKIRLLQLKRKEIFIPDLEKLILKLGH